MLADVRFRERPRRPSRRHARHQRSLSQGAALLSVPTSCAIPLNNESVNARVLL
jgi:hypothetical protein